MSTSVTDIEGRHFVKKRNPRELEPVAAWGWPDSK